MNRVESSGRMARFRLLCAGLAMAVSCALPAADDDYLNALKAEAVSDGPAEEAYDRRGGVAKFEGWLSSEYPGSFAFYSKLNDNEKDAVFRDYRAGAGIERLRERIRDLLKN